ncbi:MAG: hypothetical protein KBF32_05935 [Chitinophagales bacterium]|nr:hypothetical protein [Chitinophagales bacterium]
MKTFPLTAKWSRAFINSLFRHRLEILNVEEGTQYHLAATTSFAADDHRIITYTYNPP